MTGQTRHVNRSVLLQKGSSHCACTHRFALPMSVVIKVIKRGQSNLTKGHIIATKQNQKQFSPGSIGFVDCNSEYRGNSAYRNNIGTQRHSVYSDVFVSQAQNYTAVSIHTVTYMGRSLLHLKIAPSPRGSGLPSNTWLVGPTPRHMPNAISIEPAIFAGCNCVMDMHTDTRTMPHVSSNRPHLYAIRCSLKSNEYVHTRRRSVHEQSHMGSITTEMCKSMHIRTYYLLVYHALTRTYTSANTRENSQVPVSAQNVNVPLQQHKRDT